MSANLYLLASWKAVSSRKTQLVVKFMSVFSQLWTQSRRSWVFSWLFRSTGWNRAFLRDKLQCSFTKSNKVLLDTLNSVNICFNFFITSSRTTEGFSSMHSIITFLWSSWRIRGRPVFLRYSKMLSGSLLYFSIHFCTVRTWIPSCFAAAAAFIHLSNNSLKNLTLSWSE